MKRNEKWNSAKPELAKKWDVNETTIRSWVREEARLQAVLGEGRAERKACW